MLAVAVWARSLRHQGWMLYTLVMCTWYQRAVACEEHTQEQYSSQGWNVIIVSYCDTNFARRLYQYASMQC